MCVYIYDESYVYEDAWSFIIYTIRSTFSIDSGNAEFDTRNINNDWDIHRWKKFFEKRYIMSMVIETMMLMD